jgi:hypothetical protein
MQCFVKLRKFSMCESVRDGTHVPTKRLPLVALLSGAAYNGGMQSYSGTQSRGGEGEGGGEGEEEEGDEGRGTGGQEEEEQEEEEEEEAAGG